MKTKKSLDKPVLINLKVKPRHLKMLDAQARKLTDGNRSKLLLFSALTRKERFKEI